MSILLRIEQLDYAYPLHNGLQEGKLFEHLDLTIEPGSVHLLLGAPESGKSTLARLIAALIPRYYGGRLSGGLVIRKGGSGDTVDITAAQPFDLTELVGMVSQNPEEQILMSECEDEIIFPLENSGVDPRDISSRLERALERYRLTGYRHADPSMLSGGEKKRLMLAVLDAVDPDLWILDETFEELDEQWKRFLSADIRERGRSVLILASKYSSIYDTLADSWSLLSQAEPGGPRRIITGRKEEILEEFSDDCDAAGSDLRPPDYTQKPLCSCRDLYYAYQPGDGEFALSAEQFDIWPGEVLALYGPNGSGKTTLGRVLCGLITPQLGSVSFGDSVFTPKELLHTCGYLFQNPDFQLFLPSVHDELDLGLRLQGITGQEAEQLVADAAARFGLTSLEAPPALMSYGARKRLQAASAYLLDRRVTIVDETDSGISCREYLRIIEELKERAEALIIITHDLQLARKCAHRIVSMDEGRITGEERLCR